jgi:hypothetical protein
MDVFNMSALINDVKYQTSHGKSEFKKSDDKWQGPTKRHISISIGEEAVTVS